MASASLLVSFFISFFLGPLKEIETKKRKNGIVVVGEEDSSQLPRMWSLVLHKRYEVREH